MKLKSLITAAVVAIGLAAPATAATTFDLTGNALNGAREASQDGFSFSARGGLYRSFRNGPDSIIESNLCRTCVVETRSGLGIQGGWLENPDIDGFIGNEVITFFFDTVVSFTGVSFGRWDSNDDFDLFVDDVLILPEERTNSTGIFGFTGLTGSSISFGADGIFDNFRVSSLSVASASPTDASIPLPASAWLLLAGMGGLFAMGRRKKA